MQVGHVLFATSAFYGRVEKLLHSSISYFKIEWIL